MVIDRDAYQKSTLAIYIAFNCREKRHVKKDYDNLQDKGNLFLPSFEMCEPALRKCEA